LVEDIYSYEGDSLALFNIRFITKIASLLFPEVELLTLSDIVEEVPGKNTDALIGICKKIGATHYIS
jgi:hypothetical protein